MDEINTAVEAVQVAVDALKAVVAVVPAPTVEEPDMPEVITGTTASGQAVVVTIDAATPSA